MADTHFNNTLKFIFLPQILTNDHFLFIFKAVRIKLHHTNLTIML